ncbi:MAG TPA: ABC transporter permease [Acidimicrobiia bacterium]
MIEFLGDVAEFLSSPDTWWGPRGLLVRTRDHVLLSAFAVAVAAAISLPPALWLGHRRRGGATVSAIVNIGRAVPSFGIVALMLPISLALGLGLGFWPTFVALVALAMPPIFTNSYTAVAEVDPAIREAALGMGMTGTQLLVQTELPLAMPVIWTALRVSAVQVVATATLGAVVGWGGLGRYVIDGFAQGNDTFVFVGGAAVALLAVLTDQAFSWAERLVLPAGTSHRDRGELQDKTIAV